MWPEVLTIACSSIVAEGRFGSLMDVSPVLPWAQPWSEATKIIAVKKGEDFIV